VSFRHFSQTSLAADAARSVVLPKASTAEALEALLPWNVKPLLRALSATAA
jgi:hypothetical protein